MVTAMIPFLEVELAAAAGVISRQRAAILALAAGSATSPWSR
ncbi:hypothetical protein ACMT9Y_08310 [Clavibacter tessellarius]